MQHPTTYRLPDTIVVGPQRTGTTWLYQNLTNQVGLPKDVKETLFFDKFYHQGIDWYANLFQHCPPGLPIVEVAPSYFHSAEARERIHRHIPGCRIICILRCPVERAYSLYRLLRFYGQTDLSFEEAFQDIPLIKDSSRYATHLSAWQQKFGRKQILVFFFDDLKRDPRQYLQEIGNVINLPNLQLNDDILKKPEKETLSRNTWLAPLATKFGLFLRARQRYGIINFATRLGLRKFFFEGGGDLPPLAPETKLKLRAYFQPEVERLEELLGCDLSRWKVEASHR